jgi:tetratricopeptide (TPR) repeat protein
MKTPRFAAYVLFLCLASGFFALRLVAQSKADYDRAVARFLAGDYIHAAEMFAAVDDGSPGATDALLYRAKCLVHTADFPAAEQSLRSYLRYRPQSSDALYMLGFVLNRENRPADSLETYTRAAALEGPTSDDLKIVGLDYALLGDYADAIKWLGKAVALDPNNKDAWYYLGRAYYTRAQLSDARAAFQRVLDLDPTNAKAENNLGLVFETKGEVAAAEQAYRKAIAWGKDSAESREQPYVNLGNLLAEQNRNQEAAGLLETAVSLAPKSPYCHLILGVLYRKVEKLDAARRELILATSLDPQNPIAHYQLGRVYKDNNELDRAKAEFERTAELQSRAAAPKPPPH